jgi:hypothetical protein
LYEGQLNVEKKTKEVPKLSSVGPPETYSFISAEGKGSQQVTRVNE